MIIKYFKHHEIDKKKYDECILQSPQGTMYAMSWYLETVSPGWELLASENFDIVMPIPIRKKFGITFSAQPLFCQQLGIFSLTPPEINTLWDFVEKIPYSYYRLQLNAENFHAGLMVNSPMVLKQNYVLDLSRPYEIIREGYNSDCLGNLKKAQKKQLQFSKQTETNQFFETLLQNAQERTIINQIPLLKRLMETVSNCAKFEIWNSRNESGEILSCVLFLYWKNRVYNLVAVSSSEGKKVQSMRFLIDQFIRENASSELILDFEGSSIPGIALFYKGFGSVCENYPVIAKDNFLSKVYFLIKKL